MKLTKNSILLLTISLLVLIIIPAAYSWGVSSPYWKSHPMRIAPGETIDFNLTLQNMVDNYTITVKVDMIDENGIAELMDTNTVYDIPFGRKDIGVPISVTMLKQVTVGDKYEFRVRFRTVTYDPGGGVSIGIGYDRIIPVVVVMPDDRNVAPYIDAPKGMEVRLYQLDNKVKSYISEMGQDYEEVRAANPDANLSALVNLINQMWGVKQDVWLAIESSEAEELSAKESSEQFVALKARAIEIDNKFKAELKNF